MDMVDWTYSGLDGWGGHGRLGGRDGHDGHCGYGGQGGQRRSLWVYRLYSLNLCPTC